ncbi:MAG TPA: VWA domain-containing protein [Pyrinomonadaceae bacterium]
MPQLLRRFFQSLTLACALCGCLLPALGRQEPARPPQEDAAAQDDEEPIRIETDLIQTGVMVFDKGGRFVEGLKQDDFELTVEGKATPVSFFDRITGAPSVSPSSSRGGAKDAKDSGAAVARVAGGARTVILFADDLHLSFEDRKRARDLIKHFIDDEFTDDDTAAVVSSSGRLGFLQQFTDNPAVLRAAAARLGDDKNREAGDRLTPPMSEYEALLIDHYDPEVTADFAGMLIKEGLALSMDDAVQQARSRARNVLQMTSIASRNTYYALEQVVRRSAQMPGRKIVILISDGFLLDPTNTDSSHRLRRITDAAARANAVVYSFDAKGLDARPPTGTAHSAFRVQSGERFEMQEPLNSIAEGTGGRFFKNRNDMRPAITQSLAEASRYYLLAWRPDPDLRGKERFRRVEVKVKGRPELTVRLQSGYLVEEPKDEAKAAKPETKNSKAGATPAPPLDPVQEQIRTALNSFAPKTGLPTVLALNYFEGSAGPVLAASVRVEGTAIDFTRAGDVMKADVDVVGVIYDSKGKTEETFSRRLSLSAPASRFESGRTPNLFYNHETTKLTPGLHQMRVAARDVKTGRVGSAVQWVEVPDLASRKLALSSLIVAESNAPATGRLTEPAAVKTDSLLEPVAAEASVDRRFGRTSSLRYLVFIYNARAVAAVPPDVTLQTQIFRGKQEIFTAPPARVAPTGQDLTRLAYAAEVPLAGLPPGRYSLRVTVEDRAAKKTAEQRLGFTIR